MSELKDFEKWVKDNDYYLKEINLALAEWRYQLAYPEVKCNCNQTPENCECHISDEVKHKGLRDFIATILPDDGGRACPCNYGEPCNERCTCVNPLSSTGCNNCCTYGSLEQREAKAKRLKNG